jgi:hypothetical protein
MRQHTSVRNHRFFEPKPLQTPRQFDSELYLHVKSQHGLEFRRFSHTHRELVSSKGTIFRYSRQQPWVRILPGKKPSGQHRVYPKALRGLLGHRTKTSLGELDGAVS